MKHIKKLLIIGLICILLPFNVFAETIKNDNGYEFEITKIETPSCVPTGTYVFIYKVYKDGSKMYIVYQEDYSYDFTFVSADGTCQAATNQQILDLNDYNSIEYSVEANKDNTLKIYKYTGYDYNNGYVLTSDTAIDNTKTYYTIEEQKNEDGEVEAFLYNFVDEPLLADLAKYYEKINFTTPTSASIDSSLTYYTLESDILTKVENPTADDILDYYVKYTGSTEETKTLIDTISDAKFGTFAVDLGHKNFGVQVLGDSGKYQFIVMNTIEEDEYISYTYDIYDKDANKLFSDLISYKTIDDDIFITYKDEKVTLYGKDLKALYTFDNYSAMIGVGDSDDENIAYVSIGFDVYKLEFKNIPDITYSISNPGTSDEIIISIIIGFISLIGLYKVTKFIRRKTRLC